MSRRGIDAHRMIYSYLQRLYRLIFGVIYSRSRFRLYLNATVGDVNLRMLALASEADYFSGFARPIPLQAPFGKSVLVVAPHQDDEAIGCGGALCLQTRSGNAAAIVMLQDGADGFEATGMSRQQMTEMRNEESRQAAKAAGLTAPPLFLNHSSLAESVAKAAEQVRAIITERKVDAVFIPFVLDAHPDHRWANIILAEALKKVTWNVRVLGYEVWGMCIPNVLVIIDDAIEDKRKMLDCFQWANTALDYTHSTIGLNMFHSRMLGAGQCRYAERFFEVPRKEYIELVERVRASADAAATRAQAHMADQGRA
jgi:LmbE family N-acetylglucosaminyl deacetylase